MEKKLSIQVRNRFRTEAVILLGMLSLLMSGCMTDEYDLSKGVDTEVSIGGDSLMVPVGSTKKVLLQEMISGADTNVMKVTSDGIYALQHKDSVGVNINKFDPVNMTIEPINITPIDFKFVDFKLPSFKLNTFSLETPFNIPNLMVTETIDPINFLKKYTYTISLPSPIAAKTPSAKRSTSLYTFQPIVFTESGTVTQNLDFGTFPLQLKKINKVYLSNNYITFHFNRTKLKDLNLASRNELINSFRVDFPSEYHLSSNEGAGSRIEGSSFIVENATLSSSIDEIDYRVKVDYIDMTNVLQSSSIIYNRDISYSFVYTLNGAIYDPLSLVGKTAELDLAIDAAPIIADLEVQTNPIAIPIADGSVNHQNVINGVPTEVSYITSMNFEAGAMIYLEIPDPGIAPFKLDKGECIIQLPKNVTFKPQAGLDNTTNVFTIPCNQLFGTHQLEVTSVNVNQAIPEGGGSFTIQEDVSYRIVGCVTTAETVLNSTVESFTGDKFQINYLSNTIQIKDANVTTRDITTVVPTQTTYVKINKLLSTDLEKLYSTTFVNTVNAALRLVITGLPASIDSVFFRNYTIQLPSCMKFADGNVNSKNEVILNRGFKVSEGFTKILQLEGFDFGTSGNQLKSGELVLNEAVTLSGSMFVKGKNLKASDFGDIHIAPSVTVDPMSLALVEAKVKTTITPVQESIAFTLPSFLADKQVNLDIQNPVISVVASNTTGLPIEVPIQLIPKKNGAAIPGGTVTATLQIAAAEKPGTPTYTKFWLARTADGASSGYAPVIIPNLANLVKVLPDNIEVKMDPVINGDHHKIDLLSTNNKIKVNYDIRVPFDFGKDFLLTYNDSITGLQKELVDIVDKIKNLDIIAYVDNQIPMIFQFTVVPIDKYNKVIDDLEVANPDSIKSGNIDGTAQLSKLYIKLSEKSQGALVKLDGFRISMEARRNSTIAGQPLRPEQYFKIKLGLGLPKGISIKSK